MSKPNVENSEDVVDATPKMQGALFPYEQQTEHWNIDFNDTNQSYEGSDLPWWVLVGFAVYIIWAIIYFIAAF